MSDVPAPEAEPQAPDAAPTEPTPTDPQDTTPWNDNGPPVGLGTNPAYDTPNTAADDETTDDA